MKTHAKLWMALAALALLTPLGLMLPALFKSGPGWGEWRLGSGEHWHGLLPDYAFKGWQDRGLTQLSLAYIVSGVLGAGLVALAAWLIGRALSKKEKP